MDALFSQNIGGIHDFILRMLSQKSLHHTLVFLAQQRARCINQTTAGFHQTAGGLQHIGLNRVDAGKLFFAHSPTQIRIAAQSTRPGAGRIDKHAVKFSGKTLNAYIAFGLDRNRVNVAQTRPTHTWG